MFFMTLFEKIESDMKVALKEGSSVKLSVLRMVVSAVRMLEIEKNVKVPQEADVLQILQRQVKQHRESIEQFEKGSRQDLADKEKTELKILESYMPEQLTENEITAIIKLAMTETGASLKSDMGKVMKAISEKVRGKADGKTVSALVMKLLK